jgi:heptose I phosphotransferase
MTHGSLWERLVRGSRWSWLDERYRGTLPPDLDDRVMTLESRDRFHAKQGRSTARVVFNTAQGPVPTYVKRHYRLSWFARLAALVQPEGRHSPGAAEWERLRRARSLGIPVPETLAAGERIGPWGALQSYLIVAELTGCQPLHEAIPALAKTLDPARFAAFKRTLIREMAWLVARLHAAGVFHQDLYLCHFYLDPQRPAERPTHLTQRPKGGIPGLAEPVSHPPCPPFARGGKFRASSAQGSRPLSPPCEGGAGGVGHGCPEHGTNVSGAQQRPAGHPARLSLIDLHRLVEHRWWPARGRAKDLGQLLFSTYGVTGVNDRDRHRFWMHYREHAPLTWPRGQAVWIRFKAARYWSHNRRRNSGEAE